MVEKTFQEGGQWVTRMVSEDADVYVGVEDDEHFDKPGGMLGLNGAGDPNLYYYWATSDPRFQADACRAELEVKGYLPVYDLPNARGAGIRIEKTNGYEKPVARRAEMVLYACPKSIVEKRIQREMDLNDLQKKIDLNVPKNDLIAWAQDKGLRVQEMSHRAAEAMEQQSDLMTSQSNQVNRALAEAQARAADFAVNPPTAQEKARSFFSNAGIPADRWDKAFPKSAQAA